VDQLQEIIMAQHTSYVLSVEIVLHDENVDPNKVVEQILDLDGVDVVSTRGVKTEKVDLALTD